ncbi:uncharacterized protein N7496_010682 [Penicillium cataractarum]|uniref:Uncharacterized protein n=1 Tax=Penicillium cataractarum TaxID=2100454 RepID=A0A9W9RU02_9EURO|nr:uncharacterized protein N7496_010682 [Penicillium cataractarum]KAJ5364969.1 hypothetical protein N7496_010682 [Penicillium cataractarum]
MWPELFPGMTYKGQSFIHEWMKLAMKCPPLFSAWLHSGAEHLLIRQRASGSQSPTHQKDTFKLLFMRQEALTALRKAVDDSGSSTITDEIIMAAFALALHAHERDEGARMKLPLLSNLQLLTRFTDIVILDGHVRGLRYLVHARGGYDKIEMPGLSAGPLTWDLLTASKWLTRPFRPLQTALRSDSAAEFLTKFESTNIGMILCCKVTLMDVTYWLKRDG